MKLALARAMLMNADIMLLDEPTNHLDVTNVRWIVDYLVGLKDVTSVVVSHDSGFLDNVCSSIIHYEDNFKLKKYLGNLSKFVEQRPEAAAYYNLADATTKWALPEPGYLEVSQGVAGRVLGWWVGWGGVGGVLLLLLLLVSAAAALQPTSRVPARACPSPSRPPIACSLTLCAPPAPALLPPCPCPPCRV